MSGFTVYAPCLSLPRVWGAARRYLNYWRTMKSFQLQTAIHKESALGLALLTVSPLFLLTTNPDQLALPLLLVPFLLVFLTLYVLVRVIFRVAGFYDSLSIYKRRILLGMAATLPVLLLLLQSLHQLTTRDIALVVALGIGLTFYLLRADFMD